MDYVRCPTQFAYGFDDTLAEEDGAFVIIFIEFVFLIVKNGFAVKVIFVVNKINLQFGIRNRSYFDNQAASLHLLRQY